MRVKFFAHFREEVEPFPRHTTIIQAHLHDWGQIRNQNGLSNPHLSVKLYPELSLQGVHFVGWYGVNLKQKDIKHELRLYKNEHSKTKNM